MPAKGVVFTREVISGELFEGRFNSIRMPGPISSVISVEAVDANLLIQDVCLSATDPCVINFRVIMPVDNQYMLMSMPGLSDVKLKVAFLPGVARNMMLGWKDIKAFSQNETSGDVVVSCDGRIMMVTIQRTGWGDNATLISHDYGATWERLMLDLSIPGIYPETDVYSGAVGGNVIMVNYWNNSLSAFRVLVSNDNGATWTPIAAFDGMTLRAMSASKDGKYILASDQSTGDVYFSNDYGVTFNNLNATIIPAGFFKSLMSSTGQYMIISAYGDAPWMSSNYGVTWTQVSTIPMGFGGTYDFSMAIDGSIIVLCDQSLDTNVYSLDHGATWVFIPDLTGLFGANPAGTPNEQVYPEFIMVDSKRVLTLVGYAWWTETFESKNLGVSWTAKPELTTEYPQADDVSGLTLPFIQDADFYRLIVKMG